MTTQREIEEAVARCVSIAVFLHNSRRAHRAEDLFEDDVRSVARWAVEAGLGEGEMEHALLGPIHPELIARYGIEIGSQLCATFLGAYRNAWRLERLSIIDSPRKRAIVRNQDRRRV
jgi:hypothetical protein